MPTQAEIAAWKEYAYRRAEESGLDPTMVLAQITQESAWNPKAVSRAGAVGLAQIMPNTAPDLGMKAGDRTDPYKSIDGLVTYMTRLKNRYGGDEDTARLAYNFGMGNVEKWKRGERSLPKEAAEYNDRIYAHAGIKRDDRFRETTMAKNESQAERSRLAATQKQSPIEALISKRAQQERQALQEIDQDLLQQVSMAPEPPAPIMQQYQPQQIGVQPNPVRDTMLSQLRAEAMKERTKPLRLSIADTWDNTEIKPEEYS